MSSTVRQGAWDPEPTVSEDELFEVLSNRRRRYAVHAIKQEGEAVELGEIAERVAAWEYDIPEQQVSYDERKRVYTALQQSHLPKMDDAGVVAYDKDRGIIEPKPALAEAEVYMDVVRGYGLPWSQLYLGLSTVAALLVGGVWTDLLAVETVPDAAWMAGVVAAFGVVALVHTVTARRYRIGSTDAPPECCS
jgi:hypothetical protein